MNYPLPQDLNFVNLLNSSGKLIELRIQNLEKKNSFAEIRPRLVK